VDLFYKLLKTKEKKMKYQSKGSAKKALIVRLPVDLKTRLDIESTAQGISQSRLATELISNGLDRTVVHLPTEAHDARTAQVDLENWLNRI
jgi:hypothetical protein